MSAQEIRLVGQLGKRFGRRFMLHLDGKSPREAIRALCATLDGFRKYLADAEARGIAALTW